MNTTSASLLVRLKSAQDYQAWSRFSELYTPLLFHWARKTGLQQHDAADLVQDVLTIVHREMPRFEYQPGKSFRGWLRTITINKRREHLRKKTLNYSDATQSVLQHVPEAEASNAWDVDYQSSLVSRAMELLQPEFQPNTWNALREYVFKSRPAAEVASEHELSVWTIYAAKSRLMSRLREELEGLL